MGKGEPLSGEWVILKNDEVIEHHPDAKVILQLAEKYSGEEIVVSKVPSADYCFY